MSAARLHDDTWAGLIADLGGTNARLALVDRNGRVHLRRTYPAAAFTGVEATLARYLEDAGLESVPAAAVLAIAGQVSEGRARFSNLPWTANAAALADAFSFQTVDLINDFVAQALAVPRLAAHELRALGPPIEPAPGVMAVIGAGTGFGAAALVPGPAGEIPIASEAGHAGFAPADDFELRLWRRLKARFGRVSIERVLSGPGLVAIYEALAAQGERALAEPAQVVAAARQGNAQAADALARFARIYGRIAADLALTFGASGGVYISGGIAPKILDWLDSPAFRAAFEDKGRISRFVRRVPTFVATHPDPGLLGAARHLILQLERQAQHGEWGSGGPVRELGSESSLHPVGDHT